MPNRKQADARPIFRWLAALTCPVFLLLAVFVAFPQLFAENGERSIPLALLFVWGATLFGSIAATGRFETTGKQRLQLFIAAKQYVDGEMTLDEYGSRTKKLLSCE